MNMKKFLSKLFAWISECAACEQAMYEALYDARIKPLIDKILCRDEKIARLETDIISLKEEILVKKTEAPKQKRNYNKKKKADEQK
jgi:hypothetical protein